MSRGILFTLIFSFFGCATAHITPVGKAGLFQTQGPIELTPDITEKLTAGFMWPLKEGSVSSYFGRRRRDFHDGIDIRANRGTPIHAAKAGKVIYSARKIRGYGNMIVIKHDAEMATVYAHNKKNMVKVGDEVKQGDTIALVGATGKATGPHLHFEIRRSQLPEDPLLYLPPVQATSVARK